MSEPETEGEKQRLIEPSRIEPASENTAADAGTKLFVIFFMLTIPPLGVAMVAAICWTLFKMFMASA